MMSQEVLLAVFQCNSRTTNQEKIKEITKKIRKFVVGLFILEISVHEVKFFKMSLKPFYRRSQPENVREKAQFNRKNQRNSKIESFLIFDL